MMMKPTIILISLFLTTPALAQTIVLKSGKTIQGKIIEDSNEYIKLETKDGQPLYLYKNTIDTFDSMHSDGERPIAASTEKPTLNTGLLDYSDQGYMLFIPKNIASFSSAPILICLPGSGIKTKQDIHNWSFLASKRGFIVLGLDVDYNRIDVGALYAKITTITDALPKQYQMSKGDLYIVGTSAGAMMSIALALHYPNSFMAVGVVSGGRLGFGAQRKLRQAKGCRLYMVHGGKDEKIPIGEFQSTRKVLEKNGAIIEYKIVSDGRHVLGSNSYQETVDWISDLNDLTTGH